MSEPTSERLAAQFLAAALEDPCAVDRAWQEIPAHRMPDVLDAVTALACDTFDKCDMREQALASVRACLLTFAIKDSKS